MRESKQKLFATDDQLATRKVLLQKLKENQSFKEQWEDKGKQAHQQAMKVRQGREKSELQFELTMKEKSSRTKQV